MVDLVLAILKACKNSSTQDGGEGEAVKIMR